MDCPGRDQLEAFSRGELPPDEGFRVREHAAACDVCTAQLERLESAAPVRRVGRYVLVAELGRGGMGSVHRAFDPRLERSVAVKLLRSDRRSAKENQALLAEARAMARLAHPNLVTVFDSGEEGEDVYIAMEHVTGPTLADWLRQRHTVAELVGVFRDAGAGLLAAHRAGLVHRDFKPGNVLLQGGLAKVSDFGLARRAEAGDRSDSAGTAEYMAPEQREGRADARSDQYAFGRSLAEALRAQAKLKPGFSAPWLDRIVARATAAEPAQRFPSMAEVLEALSRDPAVRRRRALTWAAVGLSLALAAGATVDARRRTRAECNGGDVRAAAVWTDERRLALEALLGRTLQPEAARAEFAVLGSWLDGWRALKREVCVAARVRGELSDELSTMKTLCLDRQLAHFATVVERAAAGELGAQALVAGISELPVTKDCDDAETLVLRRATESPAERRAMQPVRERLARASALQRLGKDAEAGPLVQQALDEARAAKSRPVVSEALLQSGELKLQSGEIAAAREQLEAAYAGALAANHDDVAARAATDLLLVFGGQPDALDAARTFASAALDREGRTPGAEALWAYRVGTVLARQSRFEEAERHFRDAVRLREARFGRGAPATQAARVALAVVLEQSGRVEEALTLYREALASDEKLYGPDSPLVARDLATLGSGLVVAHRLDEAVPLLEAARARLEAAGKTEAEALFDVLNNLAVVYESRREWKASLPLRRRLTELNDDPYRLSIAWATLGRVLLELGERDEAAALSAKAQAGLEKMRVDHPDLQLPLTTLARLEKDRAKARALLTRALALKEASDPEFLGDAEWALAALETGARQKELRAKALEHYREANVVTPPP